MATGARRRTIVVGAPSGLGRCIAVDRGRRGDRVVLLARRHDRLVDTAAEAGPESVAIACGVTDEGSCSDAIDEAAAELGGVDALVYSAGLGPLQPIGQATATTSREALDTNVVGAAIATASALPHLKTSAGVALYLSSISASTGRPWPGFAPHTVSKAALERFIDSYRAEHPDVRFTRVVVGDCVGGEGPSQTEFSRDWDPAYAGEVMQVWQQRGYFTGALMAVGDLLDGIDFVVRTGASVPSIALVPAQPAPQEEP